MRIQLRSWAAVAVATAGIIAGNAGHGRAEPLTADGAAQIALKTSTQVVNARAGVLDAKSGLYGAYSGVLPRLSADFTRSGSFQDDSRGSTLVGNQLFSFPPTDVESYGSTPSISGSWSILNLSSIAGLRSARSGLKASQHSLQASRNEIAFASRRQFYEVVKAVKLSQVSNGALRLARDDERRVRALFEVGSVSKSDLLRAQVRTSQAILDSIISYNAIITQRITLADLIGMPEPELGEIDTSLAVSVQPFDEATLYDEAAKNRPDLRAAQIEVEAAKSGVSSARFRRLPYVTVGGSMSFSPHSSDKTTSPYFDVTAPNDTSQTIETGTAETDRSMRGQVSLSWDFFDGLATDAANASARARLDRAQQTLVQIERNLSSEVRRALLTYREAVEGEVVASRGVESADENLKLTQEKYNVGSATILDLIDAQVQLQRTYSDLVRARAAIRVSEADLNRVRGRPE